VKLSNVSFLWRNAECTRPFRTGVCLHDHTMHSEECLSFLPRYLHRIPGVSQVVSRYQRGPRPAVDFLVLVPEGQFPPAARGLGPSAPPAAGWHGRVLRLFAGSSPVGPANS